MVSRVAIGLDMRGRVRAGRRAKGESPACRRGASRLGGRAASREPRAARPAGLPPVSVAISFLPRSCGGRRGAKRCADGGQDHSSHARSRRAPPEGRPPVSVAISFPPPPAGETGSSEATAGGGSLLACASRGPPPPPQAGEEKVRASRDAICFSPLAGQKARSAVFVPNDPAIHAEEPLVAIARTIFVIALAAWTTGS